MMIMLMMMIMSMMMMLMMIALQEAVQGEQGIQGIQEEEVVKLPQHHLAGRGDLFSFLGVKLAWNKNCPDFHFHLFYLNP